MRLAFGLGRTVRELREDLGADEWDAWLRFHAECDLPDGFLVVAQLGTLISAITGGKGKAADFAPYYTSPAKSGHNPSLASAFATLRSWGLEQKR